MSRNERRLGRAMPGWVCNGPSRMIGAQMPLDYPLWLSIFGKGSLLYLLFWLFFGQNPGFSEAALDSVLRVCFMECAGDHIVLGSNLHHYIACTPFELFPWSKSFIFKKSEVLFLTFQLISIICRGQNMFSKRKIFLVSKLLVLTLNIRPYPF